MKKKIQKVLPEVEDGCGESVGGEHLKCFQWDGGWSFKMILHSREYQNDEKHV